MRIRPGEMQKYLPPLPSKGPLDLTLQAHEKLSTSSVEVLSSNFARVCLEKKHSFNRKRIRLISKDGQNPYLGYVLNQCKIGPLPLRHRPCHINPSKLLHGCKHSSGVGEVTSG